MSVHPASTARLAWLALLLGGCVPATYDRDLVTQLDREILALKQRTEVLQDQVKNCADAGGEAGPIYTELVQVFSGTEVKVLRSGVRTVVVVPSDQLFSPGETVVRDEAMMVPDMLATALGLHPELSVQVVAHTDNVELSGADKRRYLSLWGLSMAQATGFMVALVQLGVDESRFTISGRGGQEPVAESDTPEGRAQNRRIVVIIGPSHDWEGRGAG